MKFNLDHILGACGLIREDVPPKNASERAINLRTVKFVKNVTYEAPDGVNIKMEASKGEPFKIIIEIDQKAFFK